MFPKAVISSPAQVTIVMLPKPCKSGLTKNQFDDATKHISNVLYKSACCREDTLDQGKDGVNDAGEDLDDGAEEV